MKYSSLIDNVAARAWGLNIQQAYLFEWLYSLPSWATPAMIEGGEYFFASKTKAVEELPLLTGKVDTMYRYYKQLEETGLIDLKKVDGKDYVRLTDKAKAWGRISEGSEKNPSRLGKKSGKRSEKNPTYKTTIQDKITSNENVAKATEVETTIKAFETFAKVGLETGTIDFPKEPLELTPEEPTQPSLYARCVDLWLKQIHPAWVFGAVHGKAIKSILKKIVSVCQAGNHEASDEIVYMLFERFCRNLPEWFKEKDLQILDSKFNEIITQIQQGPKGNIQGRDSAARLFSKYRRHI